MKLRYTPYMVHFFKLSAEVGSKGVHHLNGEGTLALCRNRHRSGDGSTQGGAYARERESAKVILALYEQ